MRSFLSGILFVALVVAVICDIYKTQATPVYAQSSGRPYHVSGVQLPASLTVPAALEGGSLSVNNTVNLIVIANTDSVDHTVTVSDCTPTTPFLLFNAYTVRAGTMWPVPLAGTSFVGCIKWSASSTTVMGTIVGNR